jgi:hypothetical protein
MEAAAMSDGIDKLRELSVYMGIPSGRNPNWATVNSILRTFRCCDELGISLNWGVNCCGDRNWARDHVLDAFLKTRCDRLFWIDDDIEWLPEHFFRILTLSTVVDVVGASYPSKDDSMMHFVRTADRLPPKVERNGLCEMEGFGLGFTVIRREPLERLVATKQLGFNQLSNCSTASVFRTDIHEGNHRSEDMVFFWELRQLGYKIWLDPSIELAHHGAKVFKRKLVVENGLVR